jgi:cation:H+ antiporter
LETQLVTGAVIAVVVGLVLLVIAADRLVVSAVRLSQTLGVSAILIGAVVVGLGTSVPELLVSSLAAADGEIDVAMANVVGSNIANVTLVLGSAAAVAWIAAPRGIIRREGVLMVVAVSALALALWDGELMRYEAGFLLFGMAIAIYLLLRWSLRPSEGVGDVDSEVEEMLAGKARSPWAELLIGVLSLGLTLFGADLLLGGAVEIAEEVGLTDTFLGLLLGVGTSLPELATTIASVRRKESDLVIGNVVGSNLFNSLAVAGTAGLVGPGELLDLGRPALIYMIAVAVGAGLLTQSGQRLVRWNGAVLLLAFVAFGVLSY